MYRRTYVKKTPPESDKLLTSINQLKLRYLVVCSLLETLPPTSCYGYTQNVVSAVLFVDKSLRAYGRVRARSRKTESKFWSKSHFSSG